MHGIQEESFQNLFVNENNACMDLIAIHIDNYSKRDQTNMFI